VAKCWPGLWSHLKAGLEREAGHLRSQLMHWVAVKILCLKSLGLKPLFPPWLLAEKATWASPVWQLALSKTARKSASKRIVIVFIN
jgi:hypothetical protein